MNNSSFTYKNKQKFAVHVDRVGRQWSFRVGSFTLLTPAPGGRKTAVQVCEILHKSWHRHGKIDGAARNAINAIVNGNFKHLKNYRDPHIGPYVPNPAEVIASEYNNPPVETETVPIEAVVN